MAKTRGSDRGGSATGYTNALGSATWSGQYDVTRQRGAADELSVIFRKRVSDDDIAELVGVPDGSFIRVFIMEEDLETFTPRHILIETKNDLFSLPQQRALFTRNGKVILENRQFGLKATGDGVGTAVFARQVVKARQMGIDEIETTASRGSNALLGVKFNGYNTWPKLGYDRVLPNWIREMRGFPQGAKRLSDLMKNKDGREWWKEMGDSLDMTFSLAKGSYSMNTLRAYTKAKGIKIKGL